MTDYIKRANHRHAVGYVELRQGPGAKSGPDIHEHADSTLHNDHVVWPNIWGNPEPNGWPE